MPEQQQNRPASPAHAPDPSFSYERSHPERESSGGQLDDKSIGRATPTPTSDRMAGHVANAQDPSRSLTAQDACPPQPDHSIKDEEALGWDQAPTGDAGERARRHPRTGGRGGTLDAGQAPRMG